MKYLLFMKALYTAFGFVALLGAFIEYEGVSVVWAYLAVLFFIAGFTLKEG